MKNLSFSHPSIVNAYSINDQNDDLIIVVKTTAVLCADLAGFDLDLRDAVESEWLRLFHENRCTGGKLLTVGARSDSSQ